MIFLQRIVPKNLINPLKLQSFEIALIQSKHANKVIQILKQLNTLPVETFFLKRVRKNKQNIDHVQYVEVLLCLSQEKQQFIPQINEEFVEAFGQNIIKEIVKMELPRYAPASKKDFQIWSKYWPCNFVQPEFVKKIQHTKQEIVIVQELHKVIIHQQNINCLYLFAADKYLFHLEGERSQNGFSCHNPNPTKHPIMLLTQAWPNSIKFKENQNEYYYMTKLRLIIKTDYLCGMCAMGLVHSRVQKIYFQEKDGNISSQQVLQILYSLKLNHKIQLLKIVNNQNSQKQQ